MLNNPSNDPQAQPAECPACESPVYTAAAAAAENQQRTEDEESAVMSVVLLGRLIDSIGDRLLRNQLQIKDARRFVIAISFLNSAVRELEHGTQCPEELLQIVFWD